MFAHTAGSRCAGSPYRVGAHGVWTVRSRGHVDEGNRGTAWHHRSGAAVRVPAAAPLPRSTPPRQNGPPVPHEIADVARFTASFIEQSSRWTQQSHRAIAGRVFRHVPFSTPVRVVHNAIADTVYGTVQVSSRLGGRAAGAVLEVAAPEGRQVTDVPNAAMAIGFMNGIFGDRLVDEDNDLAFPMTLRHGGSILPLGDGSDAPLSIGGASDHVVVFVHGLAATEHSWWTWGSRDAEGRVLPSYADRLAAELGATPVFVRYNTGLRIDGNGRELDTFIDELTARWPVPVRRVSLVGHSMGGLVARAAVLAAEARGAGWPHVDCRLVAIAAPHRGSPLAKAVHHGAALLWKAAETGFVADVLDTRSAGVKDLTDGAVAGDLPDHVQAFAISATLTRERRHPIGRALGDILVREDSALGRGPGLRLRFRDHAHVGRAHHLAVANHQHVADRVVTWLA